MTDQHCIFSYGTLRQTEVQRALFGRVLDSVGDELCGFRTGVIRISNPQVVALSGTGEHPGLVHTGDPLDRVAGLALGVTDSELTIADGYEAADYRRIAVTLSSGRAAFVYVARG
jgi:hypothetical protein